MFPARRRFIYFSTPVVLNSSVNKGGSANLVPMLSALRLEWRCVLELVTASKTNENLKRSGDCVLNLLSVRQVDAVNRLSLTTGSDPVPEAKSYSR